MLRLLFLSSLLLVACDPVRNAAGVAPLDDDDTTSNDDDAADDDADAWPDDDDTPAPPPDDDDAWPDDDDAWPDDDDTPAPPPDDDDVWPDDDDTLPEDAAEFGHTGAVQYFTVPLDVDAIAVQLLGASGGDSSPSTFGGLGGSVLALLEVSPGEVIEVHVGGAGVAFAVNDAVGAYGGGGALLEVCCDGSSGGGGGATDLRRGSGLQDRIVVAGGGGGAGWDSRDGHGGHGGGEVGYDGTTNDAKFRAGGGGLQNAGGLVGWSNASYPNTAGSFGQGGEAWFDGAGCGSGGGGWYGAGAGGFAGGGGGSSYLEGPGVVSAETEVGVRYGDGYVLIAW